MGRAREGIGYSLSQFNLCKNRNIFECFCFCLSSCRHFVDSLKTAALSGGGFHSPVRDQALTAFFAVSHRAVKAAGSWIAVSESILRFMSMPAIFRPCMKLE